MSESILGVVHKRFSYVRISSDPIEPIELCEYEGGESGFQSKLKEYFSLTRLTRQQKKELGDALKEDIKKKEDVSGGAFLSNIESESMAEISENSYQIIPLLLPSSSNNYEAVNAYIDGVGRVKGLDRNARASRITSNDIRGDCFISKTFDNEEEFKRISFTIDDFNQLLENPPTLKGVNGTHTAHTVHTPQTLDAARMFGQGSGDNNNASLELIKQRCNSCFKQDDNVKLMACSKCRKVTYCSITCQRKDWPYHKRICQ